jgi:hypothetical protein
MGRQKTQQPRDCLSNTCVTGGFAMRLRGIAIQNKAG